MKRIIITNALILLFLLLGTIIAILYGRGYLFKAGEGRIEGTGLLVLTSKPDGARVYINDHLTTATNNTINLSPGVYKISIQKDGYLSWSKTITIQKEIVSRADALLFPSAPKLEALTLTGADNPIIDPTNSFIAYTVSSGSAEKNGIYVLDMNSRPILNFGGAATQMTNANLPGYENALLRFSPDSTQIVASITTTFGTSHYLLNNRSFSAQPQDITNTLFSIDASWERLAEEKRTNKTNSLPRKVRDLMKTDFAHPVFSPDEFKILYQASQSATLPIVIEPRRIPANTTEETRTLKEGNFYVYDLKEDRNYLVFDADAENNENYTPSYLWHPDSNHLLYIRDKRINVVEYDGENTTTIYSGPFEEGFLTIWPDASRLVIRTNINSVLTPYNLYTVTLK